MMRRVLHALVACALMGSWAFALPPKARQATAKPAVATQSGKWTVRGKIGVTESNNDVGMQGGVIAEYALSNMLSWRTDLNFRFPDLSNMDIMQLNVPTNLLLYPLGSSATFCPYVGPGLNFVLPLNDDFQAGFNGVVGMQMKLPNRPTFGLEGRYTVPDFGKPAVGGWEVALTGSWNVEF